MTIDAAHCEAVLRGMSKQANKDGDWIEVKFQVHPQEVPQALWDAALRSRWQLAFVEIGDDEQPVQKAPEPPRERKPATTRAEKARRLCGVKAFQDFVWQKVGYQWGEDCDPYVKTSDFVKSLCGVKTKANLDPPPDIELQHYGPAHEWDALLAEFEQQTGRMAERH